MVRSAGAADTPAAPVIYWSRLTVMAKEVPQ